MDIHTAKEQAYKDGYTKGYVDALEYATEQLKTLRINLDLENIKVVPCTQCKYNAGVFHHAITCQPVIQCVRRGINMVEMVPENYACDKGEIE